MMKQGKLLKVLLVLLSTLSIALPFRAFVGSTLFNSVLALLALDAAVLLIVFILDVIMNIDFKLSWILGATVLFFTVYAPLLMVIHVFSLSLYLCALVFSIFFYGYIHYLFK